MRFKEARKGKGVRGEKARNLLEAPLVETGFKIEELIHSEDLVFLRKLIKALVKAGRLFNASQIISGISIGYGKRPEGFDAAPEPFKTYITKSGYGSDVVLGNVVIAYPELRPDFSNLITAYWVKTTGGKVPVKADPQQMVLLSILAPRRQADLRLDQTVLAEKEDALLKELSKRPNLEILAVDLFHCLLVDSSFKQRIPDVEGLKATLRAEILSSRSKREDESWKHIASMIKALKLLYAEQSGIDPEGNVYATLPSSRMRSHPTLPERSET